MDINEIYTLFEVDARKIASSLGVDSYYIGDVLSDFYLKLHKMKEKSQTSRLLKNGTLNTPYLGSIVYNIVFSSWRRESRYIDLDSMRITLPVDNQDQELKVELAKMYIEKIPYFFDKELLRTYLNSDNSMRDISKGTRISLTTIFRSLKYSKDFVKNKVNLELKKI